MKHEAWTTIVPRPTGREIIVVKLPKGGASSRWLAGQVINTIRSRVPLERLAWDVVIVNGEPKNQPMVIGSSAEAESFVRAMLPELDGYRWKVMTLDG